MIISSIITSIFAVFPMTEIYTYPNFNQDAARFLFAPIRLFIHLCTMKILLSIFLIYPFFAVGQTDTNDSLAKKLVERHKMVAASKMSMPDTGSQSILVTIGIRHRKYDLHSFSSIPKPRPIWFINNPTSRSVQATFVHALKLPAFSIKLTPISRMHL